MNRDQLDELVLDLQRMRTEHLDKADALSAEYENTGSEWVSDEECENSGIARGLEKAIDALQALMTRG